MASHSAVTAALRRFVSRKASSQLQPLPPLRTPESFHFRRSQLRFLIFPTLFVIALVARVPQLSAVLWMLTGGPLTVALYRRRRVGRVTPGIGAKLGALTGLFGFAISGVLCILEYVALRGNAELRSALEEQLKQVARSAPDAQHVIEQFLTPHGLSIALIVLLVAFPLVSAIGGALTAGLLGDRDLG